MAKQKIVICLTTVALLLSVVIAGVILESQETSLFYVEIFANEQIEKIELWQSESGDYYIFLPSYAKLQQVKIHPDASTAVSIDGIYLYEGLTCDVFQPNVAYKCSYNVCGRDVQKNITFLCSENIAAMYIDTQSQSMEYIHNQKGNKEAADARLYTADGNLDFSGALETIEGRGNSTWTYADKKGYNLNTILEADLLGLGKAQKWILLANAFDESNIRNKIVYDFADKIGLTYSPDSQWVDLYLNGEYAGLYLLCERNEVHQERVNIAHEESILVSMEFEDRLVSQNITHIITPEQQALRIHYPENTSQVEITNIAEKLEAIERAILAEEYIDASTGKELLELIDMESWVKKYLLDEVFGNLDGGCISQYFYFDGNEIEGKCYAGPAWDYDLTMGGDYTWQMKYPESFFVYRSMMKEGKNSAWWYALYHNDEFYSNMVETYQNEVLPSLEPLLESEIYAYAAEIEAAAQMNQIRWNIPSALTEYVEDIRSYMTERVAFLSSVWIEEKEYCRVTLQPGFQTNYAHYMVPKGAYVKEMPTIADTADARFLGWHYSDTDEPFDITQPITEDIEIYAKWETKSTNKIKQILKLAPLGCIAIIGVGLVWIEFKRMRKSR